MIIDSNFFCCPFPEKNLNSSRSVSNEPVVMRQCLPNLNNLPSLKPHSVPKNCSKLFLTMACLWPSLTLAISLGNRVVFSVILSYVYLYDIDNYRPTNNTHPISITHDAINTYLLENILLSLAEYGDRKSWSWSSCRLHFCKSRISSVWFCSICVKVFFNIFKTFDKLNHPKP